MSPVYRWVEHTGELEIEIEAEDEPAVFRDALEAVIELTGGETGPGDEARREGPGTTPQSRDVEVTASDRAVLLAEWIEELLFLAETEDFVPLRIERLELGPDRLRAAIEGQSGQPRHLVKAVTYHRLRYGRSGGGWQAGVVLDV